MKCLRLVTFLSFAQWSGIVSAQPPSFEGNWINRKGTIQVKAEPCHIFMCGWIVKAAPAALETARRRGADELIGVQVLKDYRQISENTWKGTVFVPDRQASVSSTLKLIDANTLKITGCLIPGLFCKSQIWRRVLPG